jgi:predicted small lipoprotein YifL
MRKLFLFVMLAFAVTACGVKNDLVKPNGQTNTKDQPDPSKPPYPLGR